jgi:hypothetical protein
VQISAQQLKAPKWTKWALVGGPEIQLFSFARIHALRVKPAFFARILHFSHSSWLARRSFPSCWLTPPCRFFLVVLAVAIGALSMTDICVRDQRSGAEVIR